MDCGFSGFFCGDVFLWMLPFLVSVRKLTMKIEPP